MAVKRAGGSLPAALRIVLLSYTLSLTFLLALVLLHHDALPHGAPLRWALTSGLFGGSSVLAFYLCLAQGAMGSSAAVSGLLAAAIPALVSGVLEGSPAPLHLLGFALAGIAIWLIASSPQAAGTPRRILLLAIVAGAGFGLYFVCLRMAGVAGVVWPLALSRCGSGSVCLLGLLFFKLRSLREPRAPIMIHRQALLWGIATAAGDTAGNFCYIAATRAGRLDIAAVLASLYPASTILLAAWLLRERPNARQGVGMALAAAAVVLIAR